MRSKQQQILETALTLFAREGYHRVGVDRVAAEAGATKMTMYKYFPSKTQLVVEVLKERDRRFRTSMVDFVTKYDDVVARLHAIFAWHHHWFHRDDFHGCMFINAAAEFHDAEIAIRRISAEHKRAILDFIADVLRPAVAPEVTALLASGMALLLDGAIVAAHVGGDKDAAVRAWNAARRLLPQEMHAQAVSLTDSFSPGGM